MMKRFTPAQAAYYAKLQDPRWQKKRLEILSRDDFACSGCGSKENPLNVHHRYYVKAREPWGYPGFAYMTLCKACHDIHHDDPSCIDIWESLMDIIWGGSEDSLEHVFGAIDEKRCVEEIPAVGIQKILMKAFKRKDR